MFFVLPYFLISIFNYKTRFVRQAGFLSFYSGLSESHIREKSIINDRNSHLCGLTHDFPSTRQNISS